MTKREELTKEFIGLLKKADTATRECIEKALILYMSSRGFKIAFEAAIPSGEDHPPADVMRNLVNEWAEREGL